MKSFAISRETVRQSQIPDTDMVDLDMQIVQIRVADIQGRKEFKLDMPLFLPIILDTCI